MKVLATTRSLTLVVYRAEMMTGRDEQSSTNDSDFQESVAVGLPAFQSTRMIEAAS